MFLYVGTGIFIDPDRKFGLIEDIDLNLVHIMKIVDEKDTIVGNVNRWLKKQFGIGDGEYRVMVNGTFKNKDFEKLIGRFSNRVLA